MEAPAVTAQRVGRPLDQSTGDQEFEQFVLAIQEKALRLAHSYLGDWEEARDAVQESFLKAYRRGSQFRGQAEMGTWFYRILANHCTDLLRRRKVRSWLSFWREKDQEGGSSPLESHPDPNPGPAEEAEGRSFRLALAAALRRLPRRQREVFRMRALGGLTSAEVAGALGLSEGTVKAHLFRATRALQIALEPWRGGGEP
jgi:RNA polymerase sigma-70 factor (ECF subfamily)